MSNQDITIKNYFNGTNNICELKVCESKRKPVDVCCVIDISGSMGTPAVGKGEENNGLTILSLVNHCIKSIIANMNSLDNILVVVYNNRARNLLINYNNYLPMTEANKSIVINLLEDIMPTNGTNIWDGLKLGADLLGNLNSTNSGHLILLTDGVPNFHPKNSYNYMVKNEISELYPNLPIHTLGFGYNIISELLDDEIAQITNGYFGFISDPKMMGTVITYLAANLFSYMGNNAKIKIGEHIINIGNLHFGQTKTVLLPEDDTFPNIIELTNKKNSQKSIIQSEVDYSVVNSELIYNVIIRTNIIDLLSILISAEYSDNLLNIISGYIQKIEDIISSKNLFSNKIIMNMLEDIKTEVSMGYENYENYKKWGHNYYRSLRVAYTNELCTNFKDKGIQHYGGKLFNDLFDEFEDKFLKIPLERPRVMRHSVNNSTHTRPVISARDYMNVDNGCFGGDCIILCKDGPKQIKDLLKNDVVITPYGDTRIKCVIKTNANTLIHKFESGLKITPYHPIRVNNEWVFPLSQLDSTQDYIDDIYNLVLENYHIVYINDKEVITLGHNYRDNKVVSHDYFGTNKIIEDLEKYDKKGYEDGYILLEKDSFKRNSENGLIDGLM